MAGKEEVSLTDTVTMNGTHSYIPEEDTVYKDVELTVDVHPTERLVETITNNGITDLSGEWKDASITVDVPSTSTVTMTQAQYNALKVKDSNTIYLIKG